MKGVTVMMRTLELYRLPSVKPSKCISQLRRRAFESLMLTTCAFLAGTYAILYIIVTLKSISSSVEGSGEMLNQSRKAFGRINGKTIDDTSVLQFKSGLRAASQAYKEIHWNNTLMDEEVVHVILTRFMQTQSNLIHLGKARLELFEAFCLPSMIQQTNQNFVWLIRTDPKLNSDLLSAMIEMLRPYPNYILVKSNSNPDDFRDLNGIRDILKPGRVVSGDVNIVKEAHRAAQTRYVLETRLDADDGLNVHLVDYLQMALKRTMMHNRNMSQIMNEHKWVILCASDHYEWHAMSPSKIMSSGGDGPFKEGNHALRIYKDYSGLIKPRRENICITPGLTKAYGPQVNVTKIPTISHHRIHRAVRECNDLIKHMCLRRFDSKKVLPAVIRARTPTSAGMANIDITNADNYEERQIPLYATEVEQDRMWNNMKLMFNISRDKVRNMRVHILNNLSLIAQDNLEGQCTKGHSCKEKSKEKLLQLVSAASAA